MQNYLENQYQYTCFEHEREANKYSLFKAKRIKLKFNIDSIESNAGWLSILIGRKAKRNAPISYIKITNKLDLHI